MSQSTKFGRRLFIFTFVICILMIAVTAESIIVKRNEAGTDIDETITNATKNVDETVLLVGDTDTYKTNAISYEDKSDSIPRGNRTDIINYYEIDGLIDKTVQNTVNEEIKNKAYKTYYEELEFLKNSLDEDLQDLVGVYTYSYLGFNISNVVSVEFMAGFEWTSDEIDLESYINDTYHYTYCGYTCSLVNGEEIKLEDIFLQNTNLTYIVQRAIYNDLAWEYMYNSEEYTYDFSEMEYEDIENKVYNQIQKFKRLQTNNELEYYVNGNLYIYGINDSAIAVELIDYTDYVTLYNKYLTDTSIYVDDTLSVSNIFPFEVVTIDENSKIYREVTENSFVDMYIFTNDELKIASDDMDKLTNLIDNIKEEICNGDEGFVNMGYIYLYSEDQNNPNNVSVMLFLTNYSIDAEGFSEFYQVIKDTYQKGTTEVGVHYISGEYDYTKLYETYINLYYDTDTETITQVEYCSSDLKLFDEFVTSEDEEY